MCNEPPDKFDIILDGWGHDVDKMSHLLAVYEKKGQRRCSLLPLSPLFNELNHTANNFCDIIENVLAIFHQISDNVFLKNDNKNTLKA